VVKRDCGAKYTIYGNRVSGALIAVPIADIISGMGMTRRSYPM